RITSVDMTGVGTMFHPNNDGTNPILIGTWEAGYSTTTHTGTLPASGVLAHVTVSTVGVPLGVYTVSLTTPLLGPSDLATDPGNDTFLVDGYLIVPEPSTALLALVGLAGLAAWGWRRRSV